MLRQRSYPHLRYHDSTCRGNRNMRDIGGKRVLCLAELLTRISVDQQSAADNVHRSRKKICGTFNWPEDVQHLRRTVATEANLEYIKYVISTHQIQNEDETTYVYRFNSDAYCCARIQYEGNKINIYVNSLLPSIQTVLSSFQNNQTRFDLKLKLVV